MVNLGRCSTLDVVCVVACVVLVAGKEEEGKNAFTTEGEGEECAASHADGDEEAIYTALVALALPAVEIGDEGTGSG